MEFLVIILVLLGLVFIRKPIFNDKEDGEKKDERFLKRTIVRFFIYFSVFFTGNVILGAIFKPSGINAEGIVRAASIASGAAFGAAVAQYFVFKKVNRK